MSPREQLLLSMLIGDCKGRAENVGEFRAVSLVEMAFEDCHEPTDVLTHVVAVAGLLLGAIAQARGIDVKRISEDIPGQLATAMRLGAREARENNPAPKLIVDNARAGTRQT